MLSIILYGRNDSYGYNLHKRAAISLNCMAEVLSDPDDEILFVDYNTPDDFPTFPEAIQDTLTPKAKSVLRILRVRPSLHARFEHKTHLKALEPVARNVALWRSNPANKWILSTNTDMVFVPGSEKSLTDIVRDIPDGHYGIPRFEVPETLWESVHRSEPETIIKSFKQWGSSLYLNEVVYNVSPHKFDAPGDFQLMLRERLFAMQGFHEEMLLGWHVDANIAKRMSLLFGDVTALMDEVFGYHCDHTRQSTPAHRNNAVENSWATYVLQVGQVEIPEQATTWGCQDVDIEELRLGRTKGLGYLASLNRALPTPLNSLLYSSHAPEAFGKNGYSPEHVLPFLADLFASLPSGVKIGWFGAHRPMLDLFLQVWSGMGSTQPILVPADCTDLVHTADVPGLRAVAADDVGATADILIFDFIAQDGMPFQGFPGSRTGPLASTLLRVFLDAVAIEQSRLKTTGHAARRFIGINAVHNRFEKTFSQYISVTRSPLSTRVRHGFLVQTNMDGGASRGNSDRPHRNSQPEPQIVLAHADVFGQLAYKPFASHRPGTFALDVNFEFSGVVINSIVRRLRGLASGFRRVAARLWPFRKPKAD